MKKNYIILITALFVTVGQLCMTLYLPALPNIAHDLHTNIGSVQLSMTVFLVSFGVSQLFYGFLSDYLGRKICILFGLVIVTIATLLLILMSNSYLWFMVARFLQGMGAGSVSVLARAIVRDISLKDELAKALSLILISVSLSPAVSPFIGGWIAHYFGWLMIFKILLVYSLLIIILIIFLLPETLNKQTIANNPLKNIKKVFAELFTHESYLLCVFIVIFCYACQILYLTISPFIFLHTYHTSPAIYGTLFLIPASGFFVGNVLINRLTKKINGYQFITCGISLISLASLLLFILPLEWLNEIVFLLLIFLMAIGVAFTFTNALTFALQPFAHSAGVAASVSGFTQMLGSALLIAIASYFHIETIKPLAVALLSCSAMLIILLVIIRKRLV
jgi:DHA1 family 2-module integral membrane pump EmrD-like MFS transporter